MIPSFESRHARGGRACPQFGGDSESQANSQQDDRRNVVGDGGYGISGDGSAIYSTSNTYVQSVDRDIVARALDSVDVASAANRQGFEALLDQSGNIFGEAASLVNAGSKTNAGIFEQLIDTGREMFNTTQGLIGQTQQSVADAYSMAQTDAKGTIDNRTIIVLALAGVAVVVLMAQRKG